MLCFRDMTFCASNCVNSECRRHFGPDDMIAAAKWWESFNSPDEDPPVAFSDFSDGCKDYKPAEGE
jgi:hypothetical protein